VNSTPRKENTPARKASKHQIEKETNLLKSPWTTSNNSEFDRKCVPQ